MGLRRDHLLLISLRRGVGMALLVGELGVRCRRKLVGGRIAYAGAEVERRGCSCALRDGNGVSSGWCRHPDRRSRGCCPHGLKASAGAASACWLLC